MIVLDASAAIEWLLQTSKSAEIEGRLFPNNGSAQVGHTPQLLDIEVVQVLRRHVATGLITASRGLQAIEYLRTFPLVRYSHDFLLPRVWDLRANLTAYDAVYVALAESLNAPLLTCDERIAAAPGHHAQVEVV